MVDYTPAAAVSAGDVVIVGGLTLIAHNDIAASKLGAIGGGNAVYKATADGAIGAGRRVFWDTSAKKVTLTSSGNRFLGYAINAASADGDIIDIMHLQSDENDVAAAPYAATAASTAVTNTTTQTAFDRAVTIPANTLKVGDVIRVRAQGIATATNSTDTLNATVRLGTTDIIATGAVDVANNDIFYLDIDIVIRTIGASGTLVAAGLTAIGASGTITAKAAFKASTTIDTTADLSVNTTATWSVANAGNSCRLDVMDVQLIRA